jgi:hypothetical protein
MRSPGLTTKQLLRRLYHDKAYVEMARIVGYGGCPLAEFWEKAKPLSITQGRLLSAVYDLTRPDKREGPSPHYELMDDVKHCCWQMLGPPPGHLPYAEMRPKAEPEQTEEAAVDKIKKQRKARGRGR